MRRLSSWPGRLTLVVLPVLFLVGRNEKICSPLAAIARLNAVVPQVQTRLIENAGHDLTLVQADKVDHGVLEFLAQPPSSLWQSPAPTRH